MKRHWILGRSCLMYEYKITQVLKVVDGDTLDVLIDVGFNMLRKERIRINRVDAPETNSKNELEKKLGQDAKEFVSEWVESQNRILGEIYGDENCLNDMLIENGLAWEYDGSTKNKDLILLLERRKP